MDPRQTFNVLPTGTVTFLFTDVEGSTERWERDPAAMREAVRRHDAILRDVIVAHDGHVFKTIGDAFCAAFSDPQPALDAALDVQRTLHGEDFSAIGGLSVRMALHTGTSDEREGDYFGPTVNRVARLLAVGHGGQILLSENSTQLIRNRLTSDCRLSDLGMHQLKDLASPEHVFQLRASGLRDVFPPLRSLSNDPNNNLPNQLSSFVGRDEEVDEVKHLLEQTRLLTITGAGGVGKTRCALQAAADLRDSARDGVWFVEFAPLTDAALVPNAIARAVKLTDGSSEIPLERIVGSLHNRDMLLVFDNCEHVIGEAARAADAILRDCPAVRIVATSREALGIVGEQAYRLPSLAVPDAPAIPMLSAADAMQYGAIALFVDRARASDLRFTLTDDNAAIVADVCRRLDGIPLALELAAARVKILSVHGLADRLRERFRILTGGNRAALPRHRTMHALIDWSYDLLSASEQTVFRRLGIFAGSTGFDEICAVVSDESIPEFDILDIISSLVDKSLVQAELTGDIARYRLLESTRDYAREKLEGSGEIEAIAARHAHAYYQLALRLESRWDDTSDSLWASLVTAEIENLRAALVWAIECGRDPNLGARIVALHPVWSTRKSDVRRWASIAWNAVRESAPVDVLVPLELAYAQLNAMHVQFKAALELAETALARLDPSGDPLMRALVHYEIGRSLIFMQRIEEGEKHAREALAVFRERGKKKLIGYSLQRLAIARNFAGDIAAARELFTESLEYLRAAGCEAHVSSVLTQLAEAEFRAGDVEKAIALAEDGLAHQPLPAYAGDVIVTLANLAAYNMAIARWDAARLHARRALTYWRDFSLQEAIMAFTVQHVAALAALRPAADPNDAGRNCELAARMLGFADNRLTALGAMREYTEEREYSSLMTKLRDTLGAERLGTYMREGGLWSDDEALAKAMSV